MVFAVRPWLKTKESNREKGALHVRKEKREAGELMERGSQLYIKTGLRKMSSADGRDRNLMIDDGREPQNSSFMVLFYSSL